MKKLTFKTKTGGKVIVWTSENACSIRDMAIQKNWKLIAMEFV